jgi:opacity protein-like surface antigen
MKIFAAAAFMLLGTVIAFAQDYPRAQIFGGYSYVSADFTTSGRANLNGWNGALTGNFNRWLGVTTDLTGVYGAQDVSAPIGAPCPPFCGPFHIQTHAYTFLFGPQISLRSERYTPFAHALFGVAHVTESVGVPILTPLPNPTVSLSDTSFAMALGGGVDVGLSPRFAWRIQGDFLQSHVFQATQNNFRMSTGVAVRF